MTITPIVFLNETLKFSIELSRQRKQEQSYKILQPFIPQSLIGTVRINPSSQ
jgi:hypothetical protein